MDQSKLDDFGKALITSVCDLTFGQLLAIRQGKRQVKQPLPL